ncbi:CLUMA_CG008949, isoform A [Clunio marinus]|uniref:CLUMA_CG008949, isoform A n=1 Tax=Clunio marinus TaxID=568069 RepID=A0A1J1I5C2_9DIPT|nr:CLUMA_CG008949, isoform A [Clunio marinus]
MDVEHENGKALVRGRIFTLLCVINLNIATFMQNLTNNHSLGKFHTCIKFWWMKQFKKQHSFLPKYSQLLLGNEFAKIAFRFTFVLPAFSIFHSTTSCIEC